MGTRLWLVGVTDNFKAMKWANVVYPGFADLESLAAGSGSNQSVHYEETMNVPRHLACFEQRHGFAGARDNALIVVKDKNVYANDLIVDEANLILVARNPTARRAAPSSLTNRTCLLAGLSDICIKAMGCAEALLSWSG